MKFKGPFTPVRQCKLLIAADSSLPFVLSIMFLFVILFIIIFLWNSGLYVQHSAVVKLQTFKHKFIRRRVSRRAIYNSEL